MLKEQTSKPVKLVMAGGYDNRVAENREHFHELTTMTTELGLNANDEVTFLKSPSDAEKLRLLKTSHALLYTPSGMTHFKASKKLIQSRRCNACVPL